LKRQESGEDIFTPLTLNRERVDELLRQQRDVGIGFDSDLELAVKGTTAAATVSVALPSEGAVAAERRRNRTMLQPSSSSSELPQPPHTAATTNAAAMSRHHHNHHHHSHHHPPPYHHHYPTHDEENIAAIHEVSVNHRSDLLTNPDAMSTPPAPQKQTFGRKTRNQHHYHPHHTTILSITSDHGAVTGSACDSPPPTSSLSLNNDSDNDHLGPPTSNLHWNISPLQNTKRTRQLVLSSSSESLPNDNKINNAVAAHQHHTNNFHIPNHSASASALRSTSSSSSSHCVYCHQSIPDSSAGCRIPHDIRDWHLFDNDGTTYYWHTTCFRCGQTIRTTTTHQRQTIVTGYCYEGPHSSNMEERLLRRWDCDLPGAFRERCTLCIELHGAAIRRHQNQHHQHQPHRTNAEDDAILEEAAEVFQDDHGVIVDHDDDGMSGNNSSGGGGGCVIGIEEASTTTQQQYLLQEPSNKKIKTSPDTIMGV